MYVMYSYAVQYAVQYTFFTHNLSIWRFQAYLEEQNILHYSSSQVVTKAALAEDAVRLVNLVGSMFATHLKSQCSKLVWLMVVRVTV